ncbi:MAG TPA: 16S rRNA (cytidine(1402)-2'-O)-methyltransferase [Acidimicrobiales bacterium]|nr:16S rRNA (cytidine(1402)-2'-O)-methyltransferase [Acidimicrobiales bacterium]
MTDAGSVASGDSPEAVLDGAMHGTIGVAGSLVLVATPIGNTGDMSRRAMETLGRADLVCCEDTRHTGQLFKMLGIRPKQLLSLHEHNEARRGDEIVDRIIRGDMVALVSDAGTPLISDPGERLVSRVVAAGLLVSTVPGPSAVVASLSISGLPADRFLFEGFLPRKGRSREMRLRAIAGAGVTSVVYEAPRRVKETLEELLEVCGPDRNIAIVRELTKMHEEVWRGTLGQAVARQDAETRGEHVIVLGAAVSGTAEPIGDATEELGFLLAAGLSRRDAASALEILRGIPHRVAYQLALNVEPKEK